MKFPRFNAILKERVSLIHAKISGFTVCHTALIHNNYMHVCSVCTYVRIHVCAYIHMWTFIDLPTDGDEAGVGVVEHEPALITPSENCGPTNMPLLSIPPAVIVYVCWHCRFLTVTVAMLLIIVVEPDNVHTQWLFYYFYTHAHMIHIIIMCMYTKSRVHNVHKLNINTLIYIYRRLGYIRR